MIRIKICGLTSQNDIDVVNNFQPDYIGFLFVKGRRRSVSVETAKMLYARLNPSIKAVGVFVDAPIDFILSLCKEGVIDVIQLHGKEDEGVIKELRCHTNKPIIKAFEIKTIDDVKQANNSVADYILLDNGAGGTGETFDWSKISFVNRPFILAGGLHPNNVSCAIKEAMSTGYLYGVDTSSGVEIDGFKNEKKIEQFIQTVRER